MKVYLDTSSLFKLYHNEVGSGIVESIFKDYNVTTVFLSELTKIEFASTIWKKVRTLDIKEPTATTIIGSFANDLSKYQFVQLDSIVIEQAISFLTKYGKQGLRTLDSLQLSTAFLLKSQVGLFMTADNLLDSFFKLESLPTSTKS